MSEKKENPYVFLNTEERQLIKKEYIRRVFVACCGESSHYPAESLSFKEIKEIRGYLDIIEQLNEIK